MQQLIQELNDIKGVRNVKKKNEVSLKINLHSREIPGQDAEKLMGNLRKISPKIRNILEDSEEIKGWNWTRKPEKKYSETSIKTEKITDRKPVGHEPSYYMISVKK